jgi:hypothetical protein
MESNKMDDTKSMMSENQPSCLGAVMPRLSKVLTQWEIQQLYPLVNSDRDWKIDVNSHQLVDKIIELWFETQGYDFWNNPFPEVVEWSISKDKEIEFVYVLNEA